MAEWWHRAERIAAAMRVDVHIGARPYDKGWFAHCDGEEVDASNPEKALDGLLLRLRQREARIAREEASRARLAEARVADLGDVNRGASVGSGSSSDDSTQGGDG